MKAKPKFGIISQELLMRQILRIQAFTKLLAVASTADEFKILRGRLTDALMPIAKITDAEVDASFAGKKRERR